MDELIKYIWELRNEENIPLHFRRTWQKNGKVLWYIWYDNVQIAWRANLTEARKAVDVAAAVHWVIHEEKIKAA